MTLSKNIRAVLFDLDGTLLDTAPDFVVVVNRLLAEYDRPPLPAETIRRSVSNGARALVCLAFNIDPEHTDFEPLRVRLLEIYSEHLAVHTALFPGLQEVLDQLNEWSIPWGIATNKPAAFTIPLMEQLDLKPACECIICPDHVAERKPHPESLLLAAKNLGCEPEHIVYVGDHRRDIECGQQAGSVTIAAAYGYIEDDDDVDSWGADYRVEHGSEILGILRGLVEPLVEA
ncbi:HAD-IA family hydrolase [Marinimicrobium locisalis]|uniref:HAD-IA family hydrolase n=1 Tax=Marinimicrobium locisalis TaxID=546022 RepID=UPI0032220F24